MMIFQLNNWWGLYKYTGLSDEYPYKDSLHKWNEINQWFYQYASTLFVWYQKLF